MNTYKQLYNKLAKPEKAHNEDKFEGTYLIKSIKLYETSIPVWPAIKITEFLYLKLLSKL
jgi:hypothetical protein